MEYQHGQVTFLEKSIPSWAQKALDPILRRVVIDQAHQYYQNIGVVSKEENMSEMITGKIIGCNNNYAAIDVDGITFQIHPISFQEQLSFGQIVTIDRSGGPSPSITILPPEI